MTTNIYVDKNVDFSTTITVTTEDGIPLNLADVTFYGYAKKIYSERPLIEFTFEVVDAANGEINIVLTPDDTYNVESGKYVYDVIYEKDSKKNKLISGLLFVLDTVSEE